MDGVGEEWMDDDQGLIFDFGGGGVVFKCLHPSEDPAPMFCCVCVVVFFF